MKQHSLTALILILALGSYALGIESGAVGAIMLGGALELWFWVRALRGGRAATRTTQG